MKIIDARTQAELLPNLLDENERLRAENERLRGMLGLPPGVQREPDVETARLFPEDDPLPQVNGRSPARDKIALFRALFRGREDVYARYWCDERSRKKGYSSPPPEGPYPLAAILGTAGVRPVELHGGVQEPVLVLATGALVGEGFDLPRLDTLVLAFPISFRGKVIQYAGRILRSHAEKTALRIYDYRDGLVLVLARMQARREKTLEGVGFATTRGRPD